MDFIFVSEALSPVSSATKSPTHLPRVQLNIPLAPWDTFLLVLQLRP